MNAIREELALWRGSGELLGNRSRSSHDFKVDPSRETAMLSRALHCLHDAVAVVDSDGLIAYANPALEELTGIPRDALCGQDVDELLVEISSQSRSLSLQGKTQRSGELLHRDGTRIPVRWSAILVSDPKTGFFSTYVFHDLRPEMHSERLEDRLRHSERLTLLGQVFGGVAHELNNPLAQVLLTTELLAQESDAEKRALLCERISSATDRCRRILQNVLGVVHRGPPEIKQQSLLAPIREIVEIVRKPFSYDGVEITLSSDEALPEIPFDRGKLQQVVTNLVKNARDALVEAGRPGRIRVGLSMANDDELELSVSDDGPGIPPEIRDKVGKAFFTTKSVGKGTGLGLSICSSLIKEHGGQMLLESSDAGGLTVRVLLPRETPAQKQEQEQIPPALAISVFPRRPQGRLTGCRVLIIDDEPESLESLRTAFEALSVSSVDVAANAGEALSRLREQEYDLVVCDVRMPGMSGITLYQIVQVAFPEMAERFLFLTAYASDERTSQFLSRQRVHRLDKPCELPEIEIAANQVLARESKDHSFR